MYVVKSQNEPYKGIIYAKSGTGKTNQAASSQDHPQMKNVLFANVEGGLITVAYRGDIWAEDIKHAPQLEELHDKLANGDPKYKEVRTLVIDSGTALQERNIEDIVRRQAEIHRRRYGKRSDFIPRSLNDVWQEDWGESTTELSRIFRMCYDLPMNVILTCLPRYTYGKAAQGEQAQPIEVSPGLTPKLRDAVGGYFDFVWYMYKDAQGTQRHLLTEERGVYRAKTRCIPFAEYLGPVIDVPLYGNMPEIYDMFNGILSGKLKMDDKRRRYLAERFGSDLEIDEEDDEDEPDTEEDVEDEEDEEDEEEDEEEEEGTPETNDQPQRIRPAAAAPSGAAAAPDAVRRDRERPPAQSRDARPAR